MSLRHIRGTKYLRVAAQRAGTFRQKREPSKGDLRIAPTVWPPAAILDSLSSGMKDEVMVPLDVSHKAHQQLNN